MTENEIVEAMWREIDRVPATSTLREGIRAAYHIAREHALREAVELVRKISDGDKECLGQALDGVRRYYHRGGLDATEMCERALLALIPSRPSQETTDE